MAAAFWILLVSRLESNLMDARTQFRIKNISPGQVKVRTPLSELVDLTKRRLINAVFNNTHIGTTSDKNTNGNTIKFESEHRTGLIGLKHGHVDKTFTYPFTISGIPGNVMDKAFDKVGITNIYIPAVIITELIKGLSRHGIGFKAIRQRPGPCRIQ